MNTIALFYSAKVWVTAVFMATCLICGVGYFAKPEFDPGYFIQSGITTGVIVCVPSLVLFWLSTLLMKKIAFHAVLSKLFLTMVGIVLAVLLAVLVGTFPEFIRDKAYLPIPYVVAIVTVIWAYELPVLNRELYVEAVNA